MRLHPHMGLAGTLLLCFLLAPAHAQEIKFKSYNGIEKTIRPWQSDQQKRLGKEKNGPATDYFWGAFRKPIGNELKNEIDALTVKLLGFAGHLDGALLYKLDANGQRDPLLECLKKSPDFINLIPVAPEEKIGKKIYQNKGIKFADPKKGTIKATIGFYGDVSKPEADRLLSLYADSIGSLDWNKGFLHVVATRDELLQLAEFDAVQTVTEYQPRGETNDMARELTKVNELQQGFISIVHPPTTTWLSGVPYTGDQIWVCINEGIDETHLDFSEQIPSGGTRLRMSHPGNPWFASDHGTHVAGVAAGNGWNSHLSVWYPGTQLQWRGVAPKALLSVGGDDGDVNNHSFTEDFGAYYSFFSQYNDEFLASHSGTGEFDNNVSVWAAANNGGMIPQYGEQRGFYSMLVNNKNTIKVGASYKNDLLRTTFSSMGPTRDGRIGPDICAPGAGVLNESWNVEFDQVSLVNGGVSKYTWNFTGSTPEWGMTEAWQVTNLQQSNGIMSFSVNNGGYLRSDNLSTGIFSNVADVLRMRMRVTQPGQVPTNNLILRLYWKRPIDVYYKRDDPYSFVDMAVAVTGDWQEISLSLTDPQWRTNDGGWVNGDEIQNLRLDFISIHSGMVSCLNGTNDYIAWGGTSMAAPHITGIVALMLQKYRDQILPGQGGSKNIHDNPFWNSTAKAILIHTATDMVDLTGRVSENNPDFTSTGFPQPTIYGQGPDFSTGYGFVNAVKALEYVDPGHFYEGVVGQTGNKYMTFTVPEGAGSIRVTLAWDDPAFVGVNDETHAYENKLVNNLDLYLQNLQTGEIVRPWILDHSLMNDGTIPLNGQDPITPADILGSVAQKGIDDRSNVEVVDVSNPTPGMWAIVVNGTEITMDQSSWSGINQDFSLVFDVMATESEGISALRFRYGQTPRLSLSVTGQMLTQTFSPSPCEGLTFRYLGTGHASICSDNGLSVDNVTSNAGAFLDNPANLSGGLVFRMQGQPNLHLSDQNVMRIRSNLIFGAVP